MDPSATPMISDNTSQNSYLSNEDNTPLIIDGQIQHKAKPNFLLHETNYDALPTVISAPPNASDDTAYTITPPKLFVSKLWENRLYINRIKKKPLLHKLNNEMFPELSIDDMIFVYYNYFALSGRTQLEKTTAFNAWSAPDRIKSIVQSRIAQNIVADH